jgi:hypothetical protein
MRVEFSAIVARARPAVGAVSNISGSFALAGPYAQAARETREIIVQRRARKN